MSIIQRLKVCSSTSEERHTITLLLQFILISCISTPFFILSPMGSLFFYEIVFYSLCDISQ